MRDRFQFWLVLVFILSIMLSILVPKFVCARLLGDADCGTNLKVAGQVCSLYEAMSCPNTGLTISASDVTIEGQNFTLTYGDDLVGTGAVNGCNTRAEIENIDCYRNTGAMGIDIRNTGSGFLRPKIKNITIRSAITDTGVSDTTKWSASAIIAQSLNGAKFENVTIFIYTCNSRPILTEYIDNCTLSNVTCSSTVWHQAIDPDGDANIPFLGGWSSTTPNRFTKVRVLGRFPGLGISTGADANSFTRGCYMEGGENWGSAGD